MVFQSHWKTTLKYELSNHGSGRSGGPKVSNEERPDSGSHHLGIGIGIGIGIGNQ